NALGLRETILDSKIREISFGQYEGLPYGAIPQAEGGYIKIRFPGGESNEIMAARVIEAVNRIYEANKDACVLIVTHSGPIAAVLGSYYDRNLESTLNDKISNEEVIELQIDNRLTYPFRVK